MIKDDLKVMGNYECKGKGVDERKDKGDGRCRRPQRQAAEAATSTHSSRGGQTMAGDEYEQQ